MKIFEKYLANNSINAVDVGARNGMLDLGVLSKYTNYYAFEPNNEEYQKLKDGKTDLQVFLGVELPEFKSTKIYPFALSDFDGEVEINITKGVGASSILKPNTTLLDKFKLDNFSDGFKIVDKLMVPCHTINKLINDEELEEIDYLKLDTQGNEFEILSVIENYKKILLIKTEVEFIEQYKNQKLYVDIHTLLVKNGFEQIDIKYSGENKPGCSKDRLEGRQLMWGDAYYINTSVISEMSQVRQILILIFLGFHDIAYRVNCDNELLNEMEFSEIVNLYYKTGFTWKQKLLKVIKDKLSLDIRKSRT
jgi:FkbM family methyltransferase